MVTVWAEVGVEIDKTPKEFGWDGAILCLDHDVGYMSTYTFVKTHRNVHQKQLNPLYINHTLISQMKSASLLKLNSV